MADYQVNPIEYYKFAFGAYPKPYYIDGYNIKPTFPDYSELGSAFYTPNSHEAKYSFAPVKLVYAGKTYYLPYSTIALKNTKKIESTDLARRVGEVNTMISMEAWTFDIQGIYIEPGAGLPQSGIKELIEIYTTNDAVEIVNPVTDFVLSSDDKIILTSLDMPDMTGVKDAQAYKISAKQDSNITLEQLE